MFERLGPAFRIACLGLAVLVLYQLTRIAARRDPLARLSFPAAASQATSSEPQAGQQGTNSAARPAPAATGTNVPPAVQARIDRITQSEALAPIMRPLPMALFGIAGKDAFLRAPNGQTGLLKEGDELGGVKLLRVGTNRVMIEHQGQQKELTVFSGLGGETLLPAGKEKPH